MKRHTATIGIVALGLSALLTHDCRAGQVTGRDKSAPNTDEVAPAVAQTESTTATSDDTITITTGTRLPQKVRKAGQITDSTSCLTVIDQATIAGSGAGSLSQVLRRVAGVTVRGP
jgi:outer membrane receptor for monomeric catechols